MTRKLACIAMALACAAIAAAGDNVLALLQDGPARIVAVDVNPAQTALLQLKMTAIARLADPARVAGFLGAVPDAAVQVVPLNES